MTWTCTMIDYRRGMTIENGLKVGDMFYLPAEGRSVGVSIRFQARNLSKFYHEHNSNRPPLFVVVPGPTLLCLDSINIYDCLPKYADYMVSGIAPKITLRPSLKTSDYQGWLQHGVLTSDCRGRTYDESGRLKEQK